MEWTKVYYNGLETNVEVTKCARVRKIRTDWELNQTKIGEVDLNKRKANKGYKSVNIKIKYNKLLTVQVHQLVAAAFLCYKFNGYENVVDHIDNNPLNNNINNLRVVTQRENNKERTAKSGLPIGVSFDKSRNKFKAQIQINGKNKFLGRFKTIQEASKCYQYKLKEISIHKNNSYTSFL